MDTRHLVTAVALGLIILVTSGGAKAYGARRDETPAPDIRTASVSKRAEALRQIDRVLVTVETKNSLNARLLEDCLAVEFLTADIDVVPRVELERIGFEMGQELSRALSQKEGKGESEAESPDDEAENIEYTGLVTAALRADADAVCMGTLLQEETPQPAGATASMVRESLKTYFSLVVVDVKTEKILWAGSVRYESLVGLPQVAVDTVKRLRSDLGKE